MQRLSVGMRQIWVEMQKMLGIRVAMQEAIVTMPGVKVEALVYWYK